MSKSIFNSTITLLTLIFIGANTISANSRSIYRNKGYRRKFDAHLIELGIAIETKNQSLTCTEAKNASSLITRDYKELKKSEPYYDWHEINKLLINISNLHWSLNKC